MTAIITGEAGSCQGRMRVVERVRRELRVEVFRESGFHLNGDEVLDNALRAGGVELYRSGDCIPSAGLRKRLANLGNDVAPLPIPDLPPLLPGRSATE